jgi:hypothetical protein
MNYKESRDRMRESRQLLQEVADILKEVKNSKIIQKRYVLDWTHQEIRNIKKILNHLDEAFNLANKEQMLRRQERKSNINTQQALLGGCDEYTAI